MAGAITGPLNYGDVEEVVQRLKDAGALAVSVDPARVTRFPGVWLRIDGVDFDTLEGATLRLTAHLVVGVGPDASSALRDLWGFFNTMHFALTSLGGPLGTVQQVGLVLPGSSSSRPSLAVPLLVSTTNPTPAPEE